MTGNYFESSALKSYMKIPCKFLVAKLSSFQQFLVSSLREALSYLLLENQMSHTSHASHTSHPLAPFLSRFALTICTESPIRRAPKCLCSMAKMKWLKCKISRLEMKGMISYKCKGRSARNESTEFDGKFTNNGRKVTDLGRKFAHNAPIILPYTVGRKSLHP